MKKNRKEADTPQEMHDTVRHRLIAVLEQGQCSAKDLSASVGIAERDVYDGLDHIRKTLASSGRRLVVTPAECKKCGFVFSKRERMTRPGKCPVCRSESIHDPLFMIEE